jgi:hypothetical protein
MSSKTQREKRLERAERLCREVRYQIANRDYSESRMYEFLISWMRVAPKSQYERPRRLPKRCRR